MPSAAIKAERLEKAFGAGEARTIAVKDASFAVDFGEMVYIVGPSGSGTTTLLSIISGILRPDSGSITFAVFLMTQMMAMFAGVLQRS